MCIQVCLQENMYTFRSSRLYTEFAGEMCRQNARAKGEVKPCVANVVIPNKADEFTYERGFSLK